MGSCGDLGAASKAAVFSAARASDQLVARSMAVTAKKSASAAVIAQSGFIQSGFIRWSGTATASSFAAARASRAISTTAGACTADSVGDTTSRWVEGRGCVHGLPPVIARGSVEGTVTSDKRRVLTLHIENPDTKCARATRASRIAIVPTVYCYPGRRIGGDLPPRRECALLWLDQLLAKLPLIGLTLLTRPGFNATQELSNSSYPNYAGGLPRFLRGEAACDSSPSGIAQSRNTIRVHAASIATRRIVSSASASGSDFSVCAGKHR